MHAVSFHPSLFSTAMVHFLRPFKRCHWLRPSAVSIFLRDSSRSQLYLPLQLKFVSFTPLLLYTEAIWNVGLLAAIHKSHVHSKLGISPLHLPCANTLTHLWCLSWNAFPDFVTYYSYKRLSWLCKWLFSLP